VEGLPGISVCALVGAMVGTIVGTIDFWSMLSVLFYKRL